MDSVQLDQLVERIDSAFGRNNMPFTQKKLTEGEIDTLNRVFSDTGYQRYLQDQVNRQIIRDYLTNAVLLELIKESDIEELARHAASVEGRSALSLYMLMSSVEQAGELLRNPGAIPLKPLSSNRDGSPQLELIT
ncbi:MAG: hypothetical protein ACK5HY_00800 [Parahaliea sp.]